MKRTIAALLIVFLLLTGCGGISSADGRAEYTDFENMIGTGIKTDGMGELPTDYYMASVDETSYFSGSWHYGAYTVTVTDESEPNIIDGYNSDSVVWAIKADFTGLADQVQNAVITEFMNNSIGELTAERSEFEAYLKSLYDVSSDGWESIYVLNYIQQQSHAIEEYSWFSAVRIETRCYNGYLSVAVYLGVYGPDDRSEIYDCRAAIFDLYTGEQVDFTDLFYEGTDITGLLELTIQAGKAAFTLDKIFYPYVDNESTENTEISFDILAVDSPVGVLRDMEGLWNSDVTVRHAVLTERFDSFLYDDSFVDLGEKNFYALEADNYVTQDVADKINAAMENYIDTVQEKTLMDYYKDTGMTRNELVLYFAPGIDDDLRSSLDDYLDDRGASVKNLIGSNLKYNVNIPMVLCGKCVIYTRAGAYFMGGSVLGNDYDYAFYLPVCLIFDIHTGEQIKLSQLYLEGWERAATWYDVSASFNCDSRNGIGADVPDISELVLVDLRWGFWQYEKSTAVFMTKDGKTTYESEIPNEYLNFN